MASLRTFLNNFQLFQDPDCETFHFLQQFNDVINFNPVQEEKSLKFVTFNVQ